MMPDPCPECGSGNVVEDDLYSQKQWVCEDCGSLVSEGVYTTTLSEEQHSRTVPYYATTEVTKKPCPNLIKGLGRVRALSRILRLSADLESAAVCLFERAYVHPSFLHVRLVKKEVLAGCCVLSTCRQSGWPITMATVCSLLEADPALMGVVYQDLIKALGIESTTTSLIDLLESYCCGFKLSPGEVADVFVEPRSRLVERSSVLVELASDTWIVTGRHPQPILMACVYMAWQSLKPTVRMKVNLNKFCKISGLSKEECAVRKDTVQKRISELKEVLCKLGNELPWLRGGTVEHGTVARQVDDILKHRRALHLKAMRRYEEELQKDLVKDSDTNNAVSASSQTLTSSEQEKSPSETCPASELNCQDESPGEAAPPGGEVHWSKQYLFLPPCVRAEKRPRENPPETSVTGDEEISDSEIETYLRSPDEITAYLQTNKRLKEGQDS
ncbi:transcription factor IIIB 50 kDa subunit [Hoplias malabaricus]|uniref:transcription factor IIIB 50 kDa subunit n=1 Tax=Hoplias malabaricus TaxID=27720 RepID=UPI0034635433